MQQAIVCNSADIQSELIAFRKDTVQTFHTNIGLIYVFLYTRLPGPQKMHFNREAFKVYFLCYRPMMMQKSKCWTMKT